MEKRSDPNGKAKEQPVHRAEDVRGAEIILRTRWRKFIFFGGLIGFVVLVLVLNLARIAGG